MHCVLKCDELAADLADGNHVRLIPGLERKIADCQFYFPDIDRREFGKKCLKLAGLCRSLALPNTRILHFPCKIPC